MRWSKVRKLVKESFADSVRDRVDVNVTNDDPRGTSWQDTRKRGWISVDGEVVAVIEPHSLRRLTLSLPDPSSRSGRRKRTLIVQPRPEQEVPPGAEAGDFLDFPQSCWEYLQTSLNESLRRTDPFISSLGCVECEGGATAASANVQPGPAPADPRDAGLQAPRRARER